MGRAHILIISDEDFRNLVGEGNEAMIVKPDHTISNEDTIFFQTKNGEQGPARYVNKVTDRPGLMKGWILLETCVKIEF